MSKELVREIVDEIIARIKTYNQQVEDLIEFAAEEGIRVNRHTARKFLAIQSFTGLLKSSVEEYRNYRDLWESLNLAENPFLGSVYHKKIQYYAAKMQWCESVIKKLEKSEIVENLEIPE